MKLPGFSDFLSSIDPDKMDYDLAMFSSEDMKANYNPFSKEEYSLIVKTNFTMTKALLFSYHQWLAEQLKQLN